MAIVLKNCFETRLKKSQKIQYQRRVENRHDWNRKGALK